MGFLDSLTFGNRLAGQPSGQMLRSAILSAAVAAAGGCTLIVNDFDPSTIGVGWSLGTVRASKPSTAQTHGRTCS